MKPIIAIFDECFSEGLARDAQAEILGGAFGDIQSPVDGIVYPHINLSVPSWVQEAFLATLSHVLRKKVVSRALFARATLADTKAPNKIHSDTIMGQYSAHVYISPEWSEGAGTAFWKHVTEGYMHTPETNVQSVSGQMNDVSKWTQVFLCQAAFNRLLIHDSRRWHSAEGAWGDKPENARVVLTCFFDVVRNETNDETNKEMN